MPYLRIGLSIDLRDSCVFVCVYIYIRDSMWSYSISTLIIETEKTSETSVYNSTLTRLVAQEDFSSLKVRSLKAHEFQLLCNSVRWNWQWKSVGKSIKPMSLKTPILDNVTERTGDVLNPGLCVMCEEKYGKKEHGSGFRCKCVKGDGRRFWLTHIDPTILISFSGLHQMRQPKVTDGGCKYNE
jgi:hypothetical protein